MSAPTRDGFLDDKLGLACPRRLESGSTMMMPDSWQTARGHRSCSYCGSAHPDEVMAAIRSDQVVLGPTDKNYKLYLEPSPDLLPAIGSKFYLQHLSAEQRQEFVELYNERERAHYDEGEHPEHKPTRVVDRPGLMKFGYPGYLYAGAFFMQTVR